MCVAPRWHLPPPVSCVVGGFWVGACGVWRAGAAAAGVEGSPRRRAHTCVPRHCPLGTSTCAQQPARSRLRDAPHPTQPHTARRHTVNPPHTMPHTHTHTTQRTTRHTRRDLARCAAPGPGPAGGGARGGLSLEACDCATNNLKRPKSLTIHTLSSFPQAHTLHRDHLSREAANRVDPVEVEIVGSIRAPRRWGRGERQRWAAREWKAGGRECVLPAHFSLR